MGSIPLPALAIKLPEQPDLLAGDELNLKPTAINNRLERLRALGLLTREKSGRFQVYFQTKQAEKRKAARSA